MFWFVRAAAVLIVLAIGAGVLMALVLTKPDDPEPEVISEVVLVQAFEARPIGIEREWSGYGTARAMDAATVAAEVAAVVRERPTATEPGLRVRAGEVLLRLETTDFDKRAEATRSRIEAVGAQLEQLGVERERLVKRIELAQDQVAIARRDYERSQEVLGGGAGTESQSDARLSALRVAERDLNVLEEQLDRIEPRRKQLEAEREALGSDLAVQEEDLRRATVRSPLDGTIQEVFVEAGERVGRGDPVVRVVDLSRIEVPVRLPASAAGTVAVGDRAILRADGTDERVWEGLVSRIAPESDPATRSITVFVEVEQGGDVVRGRLLPGRFVTARVLSDDGRRRIVLPRRSIDSDRVLVVVPNGEEGGGGSVLSSREVRVLYYSDRKLTEIDDLETQWAVLESGVAPGERVVVGDLSNLHAGLSVDATGSRSVAGGGGDAGEVVGGGGS